jgi:hypothetical protein
MMRTMNSGMKMRMKKKQAQRVGWFGVLLLLLLLCALCTCCCPTWTGVLRMLLRRICRAGTHVIVCHAI